MLGVSDLVEGVLGGTSWGLGVVAVAAVAVVGGTRAKPLAKQAIKGYFAATERAREWVAEAGEQLQDLYAEAKYEYEAELSRSASAEKGDKRTLEEGTPGHPAEADVATSETPARRRNRAPAVEHIEQPA